MQQPTFPPQTLDHRRLVRIDQSHRLRQIGIAPDGLLRALDEINVSPARALHAGDDSADEEAAAAAGMQFARTPLAKAVASIR